MGSREQEGMGGPGPERGCVYVGGTLHMHRMGPHAHFSSAHTCFGSAHVLRLLFNVCVSGSVVLQCFQCMCGCSLHPPALWVSASGMCWP